MKSRYKNPTKRNKSEEEQPIESKSWLKLNLRNINSDSTCSKETPIVNNVNEDDIVTMIDWDLNSEPSERDDEVDDKIPLQNVVEINKLEPKSSPNSTCVSPKTKLVLSITILYF